MIKIIFDAPYFDPYTHTYDHAKLARCAVTANSPEEYSAERAAILDPERGITLIDPPELPEEPDTAWFTPPFDKEGFLEGFVLRLAEGYTDA